MGGKLIPPVTGSEVLEIVVINVIRWAGITRHRDGLLFTLAQGLLKLSTGPRPRGRLTADYGNM
jgi:hypothetical protein